LDFTCSEVYIFTLVHYLNVDLHHTDFLVEAAEIIRESFIDGEVIEITLRDFIDLNSKKNTYSCLSYSEVHLEFLS
jgi:hypothetical protein